MTQQERARHEAGHFVVHWATGYPAYHVDITEAAHKINDDGTEDEGITFGCREYPPLAERILTSLAGPVAQHWGCGDDVVFDLERVWIDRSIRNTIETNTVCRTGDDWNICLACLAHRVDVLDPKKRNDALRACTAAVREILTMCEAQWKEAADRLIGCGRIGYDGEHADDGQEAEAMFCRWGDEYGEPPEAVKQCVVRFRAYFEQLPPNA